MPLVFLCHASEDKAQVEPIQLALASAGCEVFYDQERVPGGSDYQARIRKAIKRCDVFVFVASLASIAPGKFTLTELKFARERWPSPVKRVLPVVLQGLRPTDLPPYLQAAAVLSVSGNAAAEVRASVEAMLHELGPRKWRRIALTLALGCVALAVSLALLRWLLPPPPQPEHNSSSSTQSPLTVELPRANHFQLDSTDGIFCERNNVYKPSAYFFDSVDINIGACNGSEQFGSRTYRVEWQPTKPRAVAFAERRGYDHCFVSDFSAAAPKFVQSLQSSFERLKDVIPCKVSIYAIRQVRMSYIDLQNQSKEVAFLQFYNRSNLQRFEIEQVATTNLTRSDLMDSLIQGPDGGIPQDRLLEVANQYHYPGIPRPSQQ